MAGVLEQLVESHIRCDRWHGPDQSRGAADACALRSPRCATGPASAQSPHRRRRPPPVPRVWRRWDVGSPVIDAAAIAALRANLHELAADFHELAASIHDLKAEFSTPRAIRSLISDGPTGVEPRRQRNGRAHGGSGRRRRTDEVMRCLRRGGERAPRHAVLAAAQGGHTEDCGPPRQQPVRGGPPHPTASCIGSQADPTGGHPQSRPGPSQQWVGLGQHHVQALVVQLEAIPDVAGVLQRRPDSRRGWPAWTIWRSPWPTAPRWMAEDHQLPHERPAIVLDRDRDDLYACCWVASAGHGERVCEQCGAAFAPRRQHDRFCSARCRVAWNREATGDPVVGASALEWSVPAMGDARRRLAMLSGSDRTSAFAAVSEAVWAVTIVDAAMVRYHPDAYDGVLADETPLERRLIEESLAGLRFVRNWIPDEASVADFVEPGASGEHGVMGWTWRSVARPALTRRSPGGGRGRWRGIGPTRPG